MTPYQAVGGTAACRRLSEAFYGRVASDPVLRPFFPGKTLHCAIEEFSAFLVQFLGGPSEDTQRRWWLSLRESHLRFRIGPRERAAWMKNMYTALEEATIEEPARTALRALFEESSAYLVNTGGTTSGAGRATADEPLRHELRLRWETQRDLDAAVRAIREENAARAIELASAPALSAHFRGNRSAFAFFLSLMTGTANSAMHVYVEDQFRADPSLSAARYSGRTLLHTAAAVGNLAVVTLLLSLGADPDTLDAGGHTPLYCVANECKRPDAASVVHTLIRAGANVDADGGVKRCTALHMAARRGNLEVARALLEAGASLEHPDSVGDTPLRRAVNCNRIDVATFLARNGADIYSPGSKGLTPVLAARSAAMKQALQS